MHCINRPTPNVPCLSPNRLSTGLPLTAHHLPPIALRLVPCTSHSLKLRKHPIARSQKIGRLAGRYPVLPPPSAPPNPGAQHRPTPSLRAKICSGCAAWPAVTLGSNAESPAAVWSARGKKRPHLSAGLAVAAAAAAARSPKVLSVRLSAGWPALPGRGAKFLKDQLRA